MSKLAVQWIAGLVAPLWVCCASAQIATNGPGPDWEVLRQRCLDRPRRVIFNNDGNEPVYFCNAATAEELLRLRTAPLAGSQVDSIFYCTWSSGFGLFTHHTKAGQVFTNREAMFANNRTQEFLDKHLDPLSIMVQFAHSNRMELFWSMRMNDTHDGSRAEYGPVMLRANTLKQQHPDWLIGSKERPPRYGAWSAVDYGAPQIRDLAFRYCEEVCQNYDVDGIELDFFRHAFFFKCSGAGEPCGQTELSQMTDLLRRLRSMMDRQGRIRSRPLLLAIRVPDGVEYCRLIGLDLETWLAEHLVDILVVGGYTQLNPWEHSVALGHKFGVKVYPSLDEPRVRDEAARELRASPDTYRGRALSAWQSGVDGIYMFNFFDPHSLLWRELGDSAVLRTRNRKYFGSVQGVGSMPVPHQKFIRVSTLNPANPVAISPRSDQAIEFWTGEDLRQTSEKPQTTLHLQFKDSIPQLRASLNGTKLTNGAARGPWLEFPLEGGLLRSGSNKLLIELAPSEKQKISLLDLYVSVTETL